MSDIYVPSFSSVLRNEESILNSFYCYESALGADLHFQTSRVGFDFNTRYNLPDKFTVEPRIRFENKPFYAGISLRKNQKQEITFEYLPKKFKVSGILDWLTKITEKNFSSLSARLNQYHSDENNAKYLKNSFVKPSIKVKAELSSSSLIKTITAATSLSSLNANSKLKISNSKVLGNITIGTSTIGMGGEGVIDLKYNTFTKYKLIAWYKENPVKVTGIYEASMKNPGTAKSTYYFYYKIFEDVDFVASISAFPEKPPKTWIGAELKRQKLRLKSKISNKGLTSISFHNKILSRTKLTISGELDITNPTKYRAGVLLNFHAQDIK